MGFVPPKQPMSGRKCRISIGGEEIKPIGSWSTIVSWSTRSYDMSFDGIEELRPLPRNIDTAQIHQRNQISDSEVEIETKFALDLNDIVSLNGEEYRCIRVRWSEGEPYRITLKQAGRHIFEQSGVKAGIAGRNLREEVIDNMNPKIRHEHNRFAEMTERQLWTRLGKITTLEKLGNFAYMAERFNKPDLAIAARARLDRLGGKPYREIIRSHMAKDTSLSNGDGERLLRKLDTI